VARIISSDENWRLNIMEVENSKSAPPWLLTIFKEIKPDFKNGNINVSQ